MPEDGEAGKRNMKSLRGIGGERHRYISLLYLMLYVVGTRLVQLNMRVRQSTIQCQLRTHF